MWGGGVGGAKDKRYECTSSSVRTCARGEVTFVPAKRARTKALLAQHVVWIGQGCEHTQKTRLPTCSKLASHLTIKFLNNARCRVIPYYCSSPLRTFIILRTGEEDGFAGEARPDGRHEGCQGPTEPCQK